jgi:hypothetical protein
VRRVGLVIGALAALALTPAGASAATVRVTTSGDDSTCAPGGGACLTVARGVALAGSGDTVQVGPGDFPITAPNSNGLEITKPLVLLGNQAGVDARGRAPGGTGESVLSDGDPAAPTDGLLSITAAGAGSRVDGFTVTGNSGSANFAGAGLISRDGSGGLTITNTIFSHNSIGLYLAASGAPTTVAHNQFVANDVESFPAAGNGLYSEHAENVTISANSFVDNPAAGVIHAASGGANVSFTANQITHGGFGFAHIDGLTVTDNTFSGDGPFSGITLGGDGLTDAIVAGNVISGRTVAGIRLGQYFPGHDQNRDVTLRENTVTTTASDDVTEGNGVLVGALGASGRVTINRNRIVDNSGAGLRNEDPDADINARENWWGCNTGTGAAGCDDVTSPNGGSNPAFTPWLTLSLSAGSARAAGVRARAAQVSGTMLARLSNLSSGGLADGPFFGTALAKFASTPAGTFSPNPAPLAAGNLTAGSAFVAASRPTELRTTVDNQTVRIINSDPPAPDVVPDVVPGDRTLRPGQKVAITIRLTNRGNRIARRLRICLNVAEKLNRSGARCKRIARLRVGQTIVYRVVVRAKLTACRGPLAYRLRLKVAGLPPRTRRALSRLLAGACVSPPCPTVARGGRARGEGTASTPVAADRRPATVRAHAAC